MTQKGMSDLFEIDKSGISRHISKIYKEGELPKNTTVAIFATVVNRGVMGIGHTIITSKNAKDFAILDEQEETKQLE